ncbi:MAG: GTPase [Mycoplasmatales bacterium]
MTTTNTCKGCGIKLEFKNETKPGYSPKEDAHYCKRCFTLTNYNKKTHVYKRAFNYPDLKNENIVFVVDIYNCVNVLSKKETYDLITRNNSVIIFNKIDIIPKSISITPFINRILELYNYPQNIKALPVSSYKKINIDLIASFLRKNQGTPYFVVGKSNSGKSSIINATIKSFTTTISRPLPVTSTLPGTTLELNEIELEKDILIYDTPGVVYEHEVGVLINSLDKIFVKKEIKPVQIKVKSNCVVFLTKLFYIENTFRETINIIFYTLIEEQLHRTNKDKVNEIINETSTKFFSLPSDGDYYSKEYNFNEENNLGQKIIFVENLCWARIMTKEASVKIVSSKSIDYTISDSIFKGDYNG